VTCPQKADLRRLRPEAAVYWIFVTDPPDGADVSITDILVRGKQVPKLEDAYDLLRRFSGGKYVGH
jgi:hypothetical protein